MLRRRVRPCQSLAVILALTWVPYVSVRCPQNTATHAGCPMFPAAVQDQGAHHHAHPGASADAQHQGRQGEGQRTCCEVTGKCDDVVGVSPELSFIVFPTTPVRVVESFLRHRAPGWLPRIDETHDPPIYLRHATLLI